MYLKINELVALQRQYYTEMNRQAMRGHGMTITHPDPKAPKDPIQFGADCEIILRKLINCNGLEDYVLELQKEARTLLEIDG